MTALSKMSGQEIPRILCLLTFFSMGGMMGSENMHLEKDFTLMSASSVETRLSNILLIYSITTPETTNFFVIFCITNDHSNLEIYFCYAYQDHEPKYRMTFWIALRKAATEIL